MSGRVRVRLDDEDDPTITILLEPANLAFDVAWLQQFQEDERREKERDTERWALRQRAEELRQLAAADPFYQDYFITPMGWMCYLDMSGHVSEASLKSLRTCIKSGVPEDLAKWRQQEVEDFKRHQQDRQRELEADGREALAQLLPEIVDRCSHSERLQRSIVNLITWRDEIDNWVLVKTRLMRTKDDDIHLDTWQCSKSLRIVEVEWRLPYLDRLPRIVSRLRCRNAPVRPFPWE